MRMRALVIRTHAFIERTRALVIIIRALVMRTRALVTRMGEENERTRAGNVSGHAF